MSQQRMTAVSTAWKKMGLGWALGATLVLGCGTEPWNGMGAVGSGEPSLTTSTQRLEYGGHEYVFVLNPKTWADAEQACVNMGKKLVTIETAAEADWLLPQQPAGKGIWLGKTTMTARARARASATGCRPAGAEPTCSKPAATTLEAAAAGSASGTEPMPQRAS
ncbi:C-type lectin-like domain-containing protein [Archangium lipolyticum]|uniref:lectin-like protein n=1 Tax=Archangium lipolyticum TaxID=2970465 RepID=UPI002149E763|nr:lectin-like protein [Archangium lipolyticum]